MGAQVSSQCVSPAAGVAAEGTLEGLLARVQFDVAQQVPLLGERRSTLVALEGPLTWKGQRSPADNTALHFFPQSFCLFKLQNKIEQILSHILSWRKFSSTKGSTCVAALVHHEDVWADAHHSTDVTLELPIGHPGGSS